MAEFNVNQQAQAVNEILGSYSETTKVQETEQTIEFESEVTTEEQDVLEQVTEAEITETDPQTQEQIEETQKSVASAYSGTYHTVELGQTLYDISMKYYGTSEMIDAIKECNAIDDNYTIVEGQEILLP